jgi:predicted nucleotidyltransferase
MPEALVSTLARRVPRLAELMGIVEVEAQWKWPRAAYLWQIERDLELLTRRVSWPRVAATYRDSLRNPAERWGVAYELRTAAKLAPLVDDIKLRPLVGAGACDLAVRLAGFWVFLEVTTRDDGWPPIDGAEEFPVRARETVHREFRTTTSDPTSRDVPASEELRQAIAAKVHQLPVGELSLVVLGAPNGHSMAMEDALCGDLQLRNDFEHRVPNGLFAVDDGVGGASEASAVIWLKLRRHWQDVHTHGQLFLNPKARLPLPVAVSDLLQRAFDPAAMLSKELSRIRRVLIERCHAERIILFGSLAKHSPADSVHDASDIDLAVVKVTSARFLDRVRDAMNLVEPRVGLNLFVYTPEEIAGAQTSGPSFIRDEILAKGKTLFP